MKKKIISQDQFEDIRISNLPIMDFINEALDIKVNQPTTMEILIVEAGLGYWSEIGYKNGEKVKPYVRLNDKVDFNKVQEIVEKAKLFDNYNL